MRSANKTKKQIIEEMQAMWESVFEPGHHERNSKQFPENIEERMTQSDHIGIGYQTFNVTE